MPEMDGYVLTKKIKEDSRLNDIPVIMHSSLSADANQELGRGVGADAYVPKFEPTELAVKPTPRCWQRTKLDAYSTRNPFIWTQPVRLWLRKQPKLHIGPGPPLNGLVFILPQLIKSHLPTGPLLLV